MDLREENSKQKAQYSQKAMALAFERYQLCKQAESIQKQIAEIDSQLAAVEGALLANDASRRDIETFLAIQEHEKAKATPVEVPVTGPPMAVATSGDHKEGIT